MADQFDVSSEKKAILLDRARRRLTLRNEFLKSASDPFRHATGEGGTVFDPSIQRYQALKVTEYERFKANAKTSRIGFLYLLLPMFGFGYVVYKDRTIKEQQFRNGEVAYKDRKFKFI